jgi:DNA-binding HxlR family transcriptional regulator
VPEPRPGCPIKATVEVFGDRWSLLVLRDVMFGGRRYFRELQTGSKEGIASNILAARLRRLTDAGLQTRDDVRDGRRARYSLTEAAIQLVPCSRSSAAGPATPAHQPPTGRTSRTPRTGRPTSGTNSRTSCVTVISARAQGRRHPSESERLQQAYLEAVSASPQPGSGRI